MFFSRYLPYTRYRYPAPAPAPAPGPGTGTGTVQQCSSTRYISVHTIHITVRYPVQAAAGAVFSQQRVITPQRRVFATGVSHFNFSPRARSPVVRLRTRELECQVSRLPRIGRWRNAQRNEVSPPTHPLFRYRIHHSYSLKILKRFSKIRCISSTHSTMIF